MTSSMGPYQTENATYSEPLLREYRRLHNSNQARSGDPDLRVRNTVLSYAVRACDDASVEIGAYDMVVLRGLARREVPAMQVVIGLISRAYAAGQASAVTVTPVDQTR